MKTALATLNNNITQTESSLQTKKIEYEQSPQDSLQTEINQLESQLTTYKNQKQKIETLLPKIQSQTNNLGKENGADAQKQGSIIQDLEKEIQDLISLKTRLETEIDKQKKTIAELLKQHGEYSYLTGKKLGTYYLSTLDIDIRKEEFAEKLTKRLEKNARKLTNSLHVSYDKTKKGLHVDILTLEPLDNQQIYYQG